MQGEMTRMHEIEQARLEPGGSRRVDERVGGVDLAADRSRDGDSKGKIGIETGNEFYGEKLQKSLIKFPATLNVVRGQRPCLIRPA